MRGQQFIHDDELLMALGKFLKEARIQKGLSQKKVSVFLGYTTPQFVSTIERGKAAPPLSVVKKLTLLYEADIRDVLNLFQENNYRILKETLSVAPDV